MRAYILVLITATALTYTAMAQNLTPDQAQRQLDTNTEPAKVGNAAAKDAAAIRDAKTGWYAEALKTRDQRLQWWRKARFGCFVHWGAYSVLGGEWKNHRNPGYAEHIMRLDKIPLSVYRTEVAAKLHPDASRSGACRRDACGLLLLPRIRLGRSECSGQ